MQQNAGKGLGCDRFIQRTGAQGIDIFQMAGSKQGREFFPAGKPGLLQQLVQVLLAQCFASYAAAHTAGHAARGCQTFSCLGLLRPGKNAAAQPDQAAGLCLVVQGHNGPSHRCYADVQSDSVRPLHRINLLKKVYIKKDDALQAGRQSSTVYYLIVVTITVLGMV